MTGTILLQELLSELGYKDPAALSRAREILVAAGLTTGKKPGIEAGKRASVEAALRETLYLACARCAGAAAAPDGRLLVPAADTAFCEACGGSANRGALIRAAAAMRRANVRKLVIVGGGPGVHTEIERVWPDDLKLQIVDGSSNDDAKAARQRLAWADLVIVWGGSILSHRVSKLYTDPGTPGREKVVTVMRRGIEALAEAIAERCS